MCSLVRLAANTYWMFSLCARNCFRFYRISKFNPHHDPGKPVLLQMRKHRHREVKTLAWSLTARKWQSLHQPRSPAAEATLCHSPLLKRQNVILVIYDEFITELLSCFFFFKGLSFLLYLQWPQWGLLTLSFSIKRRPAPEQDSNSKDIQSWFITKVRVITSPAQFPFSACTRQWESMESLKWQKYPQA